MTLKEIIDLGYTEVIAKSYGYQETGIFGHYEPFGNKAREIKFDIDKDDCTLNNKTFWFGNEEQEYYYIENNVAYCRDPYLYARPDYED